MNIFRIKMNFSTFGGQKLEKVQNRDSQLVELIILHLWCYFYAFSLKMRFREGQETYHFLAELACSDVTKSGITKKKDPTK